MTDEKSTKDPKVKKSSPKEPAKDQKAVDSKQKSESSRQKADAKKKQEVKKADAKKKPSLSQKEIDALIIENADLKASEKKLREDFLLMAAEFENFKKRINKDQLRSKELYKEKMLGELLPVLDDVDRGLQHHEGDETGKAFSMVKNRLLAYLEAYDIKPFDSVGEEFDPDKHNAMLTRAEEDKGHNVVLEEFEKGYTIGKKVLRYAKVIVNIIE